MKTIAHAVCVCARVSVCAHKTCGRGQQPHLLIFTMKQQVLPLGQLVCASHLCSCCESGLTLSAGRFLAHGMLGRDGCSQDC